LRIECAEVEPQLERALRSLHGVLAKYATVPGRSPAIQRFECRFTTQPALLKWLAETPRAARLYWRDRDETHVLAGWGEADALIPTAGGVEETLAELRARIDQAPSGVRYFGGIAFDQKRPPSPEWAAFGRARFWLPRVTIEGQDDEWLAAVHVVDGDTQRAVKAVERLMVPSSGSPHAPIQQQAPEHEPELSVWSEGIAEALAAFEQGHLQKVVLARRSRLSLPYPTDAFKVLRPLAAAQTETTHFIFQPTGDVAFLGCTPERLFSRSADDLRTEALAGTRPRGETPQQDAELADRLLENPKERNEHALVVEHIRHTLAEHCESIHGEDMPSVRKLRNVQHLHTRFRAHIRPGVQDVDLLVALHPTPAVCGLPVEQAKQFIRRHEPFDRGWYAGPIGWLSRESADFHVAIRSALLTAGQLWTFAGSGIVPGSNAAEEWAEVERKSEPFITLLEHR
jgi:menaquinone-specific isochorismate synthase